MLLIFTNKTVREIPYMFVVNCRDAEAEKELLSSLGRFVKRMNIKSKAVRGGRGIELTVETRLKDENTDFMHELSSINGVDDIVMVSYNGELAV
jgi:hypothetical protein